MAEDIIFGRNPVVEALRSSRKIDKILLAKQINKRTENEILSLAKKQDAVVQRVPNEKLDALVDGAHQGVVAYVAKYTYKTVKDILQRAQERNELPFIVILDEIEDPHNLGAILRTADATGAHGVIIPKRRAAGLNETVAKTSAGAIEHVIVARVTNIVQTIQQLKDQHIWVVGTDDAGSKDYRTLDGNTAIALVIGNEGRGLSRLVKEACDWTIHIPMQGAIPSLNASVAASIFMYEVYRKRNVLGEEQ